MSPRDRIGFISVARRYTKNSRQLWITQEFMFESHLASLWQWSQLVVIDKVTHRARVFTRCQDTQSRLRMDLYPSFLQKKSPQGVGGIMKVCAVHGVYIGSKAGGYSLFAQWNLLHDRELRVDCNKKRTQEMPFFIFVDIIRNLLHSERNWLFCVHISIIFQVFRVIKWSVACVVRHFFCMSTYSTCKMVLYTV